MRPGERRRVGMGRIASRTKLTRAEINCNFQQAGLLELYEQRVLDKLSRRLRVFFCFSVFLARFAYSK